MVRQAYRWSTAAWSTSRDRRDEGWTNESTPLRYGTSLHSLWLQKTVGDAEGLLNRETVQAL